MSSLESIEFRIPKLEDGMNVYRLVASCPPLDGNSSYCNLLQCSHFASTSVAAERDGALLGFVSGYILPDRPDTLFVWQVAVAPAARGMGLASRMVQSILARPGCVGVNYIETSITEDNKASRGVFASLARALSADITFQPWMDKESHFYGEHDSEPLVRVGPFSSPVFPGV